MIQLVFVHNGYNFGSENGMPWKHISEDFKNFKMRTENSTLVMGAKTFESLPSILKGRKHIVVCDPTRTRPVCKSGEMAHQYVSINGFERIMENHVYADKIISVIGGKDLLEKALHYATFVVKTKIKTCPIEASQFKITQWLSTKFLNKIESMSIVEENRVIIDSTTSINEQIFKRK